MFLLLVSVSVFAEENPYPYSEMNLEIMLSRDHKFYVRDYQVTFYFKPRDMDYFSPKFMSFNRLRPEPIVMQALVAISHGNREKYSSLLSSRSKSKQNSYKRLESLLKKSEVIFHKLGYYGHESNGGEFAVVQLKTRVSDELDNTRKIKFFLIFSDSKWLLYSPDKNHILHQLDFDKNPTCLVRNENKTLSKCQKHHQPNKEKKD